MTSLASAHSDAGLAAGTGTASAGTRLAGLVTIALLAGGLEAGVIALMRTTGSEPALFVPLHLAVIAALAAWVWWSGRRGADLMPPVLAGVAIAAAGPVGAIAFAAATLLARMRSPAPRRLLQGWYDRIALSTDVDDETRLADQIAIGRAIDAASPPPQPFLALIEHGQLADQQTALGLIARRFDIEYLPALQAALRSANPVLRVQAAAVAAKVRGEISASVRRLAARGHEAEAGPLAVLRDAVALEAALASGLIDASEAARVEETLQQCYRRALLAISGARLPAAASMIAHAADAGLVQGVAEALLIAEGRFRDLRNLRRIVQLTAGTPVRVRARREGRPR